MADGPKKIVGSQLTVSPEALKERNEKKALVNRLLPLTFLGAFAINAATGGALEKAAKGASMPGPGPPGMAEARALKEKKQYK